MENGVLFFLFYSSDYWVIKDLGLMICTHCCPPKQTGSQRCETHCLYNHKIQGTKLQITIIIKKTVEDFKFVPIFKVIIYTFHNPKCILSCHLEISRSCLISVPVWIMSLTWKIELYFSMVLLIVDRNLSLWPAIKTLSPVCAKL